MNITLYSTLKDKAQTNYISTNYCWKLNSFQKTVGIKEIKALQCRYRSFQISNGSYRIVENCIVSLLVKHQKMKKNNSGEKMYCDQKRREA